MTTERIVPAGEIRILTLLADLMRSNATLQEIARVIYGEIEPDLVVPQHLDFTDSPEGKRCIPCSGG